YYESAKAAIEQLIAQPDPQLSLTMDLPVEKRIAQHRFTVRCVVDQALHAGLEADRRAELERLFADAERELQRGFGPPPTDAERATDRAAPSPLPPQAPPTEANLDLWDRAFDRAAARTAEEGDQAEPAGD